MDVVVVVLLVTRWTEKMLEEDQRQNGLLNIRMALIGRGQYGGETVNALSSSLHLGNKKNLYTINAK